jgi:hypothetical protein
MRRIAFLTIAASSLVAAVAHAQTPLDGSRRGTTPWGDPDLQGTWSNQSAVPLERPAALANKPFFTRAEADEVEKNALATTLNNVEALIPTSGEFNEIWLESEKGRVPRNLSTALVIDPPDGRIPYTLEGRARWEAAPHLTTERMTGRALRADSWEDRALQERCITSDTMFYPNGFYNNYSQIVQSPGYVVIRVESMHDTRVIPLDRRPPLAASIKQWLGDSRGWWEGQTLVVETTNFNGKRLFHGATQNLRLVERYTRVDHDTIDYRLTVTDPETFTQPWTLQNSLWRTDEPIFEVACHEGNIGLAAILSGARAQEQR